jgi:hypothetical protein
MGYEGVSVVVPKLRDAEIQALTFDIRRATHSIGSNVRDAAAYVLWSLSRACPPATLAPYAEDMATSMMCAACFDREVGVRRAASAAFQEGVGRLVSYLGHYQGPLADSSRACTRKVLMYWPNQTFIRSA